MRHKFYSDHIGLHERQKARRITVRLFAAYFSLGVLLVGATVVKAKFVDLRSAGTHQEIVGH